MSKPFGEVFRNKLEHRALAFEFIYHRLASLGRPVRIVETGCARQMDNWGGDGQSTIVWDWILRELGGTGVSFDISPESVAYASSQVSVMEVQRLDSVIALRQLDDIKSIDLLYLDSYDLTESIDSPAHHLAELASVYPRLKSGCIIAVDDCVNEEHGKHRFVRSWLESMGVNPIVSTYVSVWVKP